jgi:gas vesicle protein
MPVKTASKMSVIWSYALAILMQSVLFLLMFLNLRKMSIDLLPKIQKLVEEANAVFKSITDIAENIRPVARKMNESAEIVHNRVVEIDDFLDEIVEKSRREIEGIEDILHDVTRRVRDSINTLSDHVLMPVNRINALTKAVRVAFGVLFRSRRKDSKYPEASSGDSDDDTIYF